MNILLLIALMNSLRAEPLLISQDLTTRAEVRVEELCETGQWSHDNWLSSFNGLTGPKGENLARHYRTEYDMFVALAASRTHYNNIVARQFTSIGVAYECNTVVFLFN